MCQDHNTRSATNNLFWTIGQCREVGGGESVLSACHHNISLGVSVPSVTPEKGPISKGWYIRTFSADYCNNASLSHIYKTSK